MSGRLRDGAEGSDSLIEGGSDLFAITLPVGPVSLSELMSNWKKVYTDEVEMISLTLPCVMHVLVMVLQLDTLLPWLTKQILIQSSS